MGLLLTTSNTAEAQSFGETQRYLTPKTLQPGARIALLTPSSSIDSALVDSAMERIVRRGFEPVLMPHVYGKVQGNHAGTTSELAVDLMAAFSDPTIDAILATRGGYGCVRLLPFINTNIIRQNPKWLIGFSDISVLHAMMKDAGVVSIHGPMCKHIATEAEDDECTEMLFRLLTEGLPLTYEVDSVGYNNPGKARGRLVGGNWIVVNELAQTPYDVLNIGDDEDVILFFEDIGEKIYAIERLLMRLHQSGALDNVKGIIFGQFTEYKPDDNFETMEEMLHSWLTQWGYDNIPIVYNFPAGHVSLNYSLPMSAMTELEVTPTKTRVTFLDE